MKVPSTVLGSMMFFSAAIGTAQAEMCWRLSPFIDVVRVTELTDSGLPTGSEKGSTHSLVFGQWVANNLYNLPVVGAIETDVPLSTPTKLRFNVHAPITQCLSRTTRTARLMHSWAPAGSSAATETCLAYSTTRVAPSPSLTARTWRQTRRLP